MVRQKFDWWLIVPTAVLLIISVLVLGSQASSGAGGLWLTQLVAISIGVFIGFITLSTRSVWWSRISFRIFLASLALLILVLLFGASIGGARRWVSIGDSFFIQVSEIAKFSLIIASAAFLSKSVEANRVKLLGVLIYGAISALLIGLQPDLDNAIIVFSIPVVMLLTRGVSLKHVSIVGMILVFAGGLIFMTLHNYQRQRIVSFLNPKSSHQGSNYNIQQAGIAIGSGGILGTGISGGSQSDLKFLPTQTTDFIFSVVAEKLGFIGAVVVILALSLIIFRIYWLSKLGTRTSFEVLCLLGIGWVLAAESIANIAMNLGLIPVTGIQLPLMSYGGTHIVMELFMIGFIMMLSRYMRENSQSNTLL